MSSLSDITSLQSVLSNGGISQQLSALPQLASACAVVTASASNCQGCLASSSPSLTSTVSVVNNVCSAAFKGESTVVTIAGQTVSVPAIPGGLAAYMTGSAPTAAATTGAQSASTGGQLTSTGGQSSSAGSTVAPTSASSLSSASGVAPVGILAAIMAAGLSGVLLTA